MTGLLFRSAGDVISRLRREREIPEKQLAKDAGLRVGTLRDIESGIPPTDDQLDAIANEMDVSPDAIRLLAGEFPDELQQSLIKDPDAALTALEEALEPRKYTKGDVIDGYEVVYDEGDGVIYNGDCRAVMPELERESFDLIFADPPFNLDKDYGEGFDDDIAEDAYLQWCTEWIDEAVDLLKPGGSFFTYNLPKWNFHLADYLTSKLVFRDWIAVDIAFGLPIPNRLYPSHYSLLYFVKGADGPNTFDPPRMPIDTCRHCGGEQNDYGGYKNKLNPKGMNLTDVWDDIPPVRHSKYLDRDANQLSIKLLHRVLDMATEPGDRILDPFGGAGTTYAAAEIMDREWVGIELHDCTPILDRLDDLETDREQIAEIERNQNVLFTEDAIKLRLTYKDEFGFNMEDYDLSESPVPESFQQRLDTLGKD